MPEVSPLATLAMAACRRAIAAAKDGDGVSTVMDWATYIDAAVGQFPECRRPANIGGKLGARRHSPLRKKIGQLCCPLPARANARPRTAGYPTVRRLCRANPRNSG